ncbi:hypothetical protein F52700_2465 [Fusarium sp. NRRL 52700]|nr:hypothetical protein F52700_2465 [Fusarium sp. NRRL 52700]
MFRGLLNASSLTADACEVQGDLGSPLKHDCIISKSSTLMQNRCRHIPNPSPSPTVSTYRHRYDKESIEFRFIQLRIPGEAISTQGLRVLQDLDGSNYSANDRLSASRMVSLKTPSDRHMGAPRYAPTHLVDQTSGEPTSETTVTGSAILKRLGPFEQEKSSLLDIISEKEEALAIQGEKVRTLERQLNAMNNIWQEVAPSTEETAQPSDRIMFGSQMVELPAHTDPLDRTKQERSEVASRGDEFASLRSQMASLEGDVGSIKRGEQKETFVPGFVGVEDGDYGWENAS